MSDLDDRLTRLSSGLYPPDTPVPGLPVMGYRSDQRDWQPRSAAVLVPLILGSEPELVLTVRSDGMTSHAGQVALPGGGRQGTESFPIQTALRETREETGIEPESVKVLGLMPQFDTISAYRIVPVVGLIETRQTFRPCPREVRCVFTVPLERAFDGASFCRHQVRHQNKDYDIWSMRSDCWPVWGATAAILAHLAALVSTDR